MSDDLVDRIAGLAAQAAERTRTPESAAALAEVRERLGGPVRVAVAGKVKAGKSTLLNALIGEELAPTDAGECTRIVTWYHYSERPYARVHPRSGDPVERPYTREGGALQVDLGGYDATGVARLEIGWPSSRLADLVLIDTPGIASLSTDVSARTHEVLSAEGGRAPVADAVLYLLRHTHSSDLRFLEAFHDDEVARGTPVNTIGVLSRADEIGSSRLDAMEVAARVARRYERDPRLHRLCPMVVPVNGLLGHAATSLREPEHTALSRLARGDPDDLTALLLTADRFATRPSPLPVPVEVRAVLLDRLGLYGVRLAIELLRSAAATSSTELCRLLAETSGLDRLRELVLVQFESRARVLKARSAVTALDGLLRSGDVLDARDLLGQLEELTAGAHEFEEVRILMELRSGELGLSEERERALDLLLGGAGHDPAVRLGLTAGAPVETVRDAALAALAGWQRVDRHPLSGRSTQLAARAATRTLEGLLEGLVAVR